jgi:hypothetical protein
VAEVAQVGEHQVAVAQDRAGLARIEDRAAEGVRPLAHQPAEHRRCGQAGDGAHHHDGPPVDAGGEAAEQVRHGRAQGQRPDHDAKRQASVAVEPGRHQLHGRRVDSGERHAGHHTGGDGAGRPGLQQQRGVGRRRHQGGRGHQPVEPHDVRQVDEAGRECADHEPDLNAVRKPHHREAGKRPQLLQLRRDRRRREPGRQRQHHRNRHQGQGRPPVRVTPGALRGFDRGLLHGRRYGCCRGTV